MCVYEYTYNVRRTHTHKTIPTYNILSLSMMINAQQSAHIA